MRLEDPRDFVAAIERMDGSACVSTLRCERGRSDRAPRRDPFAGDLPAYARALRRLSGPGAPRVLAVICHQIRATGEPAGLASLCGAASAAVRDVRRTRDVGRSRGAVEALARACEAAAECRDAA